MSAPLLMHPAESATADNTKPRLACPFFRYDPCRHYACASYELKGFEAVKKHLERKHILKNHCARCFRSFESEDARNNHIVSERCSIALGRDEITYDEWTTARRCPRTKSCEVKWKWLWTTFFKLPALPRELIYFQDAVVEAKNVLIDPVTIQSVLKARLHLDQQEISSVADEVREALLRKNSGARPYRVCDSEGGGDNGIPANLKASGYGSMGVGAAEMEAEAVAFALPPARHALLPEEPCLPIIGESSPHPAAVVSPVTPLPTSFSLGPISVPQQPASTSGEGPETNTFGAWRTVCLVPWATADGILARLMEDPISWFKPNGPKWSDVYDHIDRDALRKFWALGNTPAVQVSIPIRSTHVQSLAAIESELFDFEVAGIRPSSSTGYIPGL
ncbi:hypothetical protein QC762_0097380 [Podospora pseudocomata]|uniref:C2H2-type domain-containing protein n=1 Tax=Podospora pseudocomata TaxID=2093779 RepID=A0ABR0G806_9PEZI|nr:hypothetical protein QC762_0097380 [Podospora pseudocomata]